MTARLRLLAPGLTTGARRAVVGADEPLDAHGERSARTLGLDWPEGAPALCAPSTQCLQTARLIGTQPIEDPCLRDWDLGHWAGRTLDELAVDHPQHLGAWLSDPDFTAHGGESLSQLLARAGDWLSHTERSDHGRVLAVASAAFIRAVLVTTLELPAQSFWRLEIEPLASVHVTLRQGRRAVRWASEVRGQ